MATWALGLSLLPCGVSMLVSLVLAIIVLTRRDPGVDHGRGRAVAALCVLGGWVLVLGAVLVVSVLVGSPRDESGRVTAAGETSISDLRAGDCIFERLETGGTYTVGLVPCAEPHHGEVYAAFDLEGDWAGRRAAERAAEAGCLQRFEEFVGAPPRRTDLGLLYFAPVDAAGYRVDPGALCVLESDNAVTGTMRGSGPAESA